MSEEKTINVMDSTDQALATALYTWLCKRNATEITEPVTNEQQEHEAAQATLMWVVATVCNRPMVYAFHATVLAFIGASWWVWLIWACYVFAGVCEFLVWIYAQTAHAKAKKGI